MADLQRAAVDLLTLGQLPIEHTALAVFIALAMDRVLGEPPTRWHPLVWFGRIAQWLEVLMNGGGPAGYLNGILAYLLLLSIAPLLTMLVALPGQPFMTTLIAAFVLYLCIGWRSLRDHIGQIRNALQQGDLTLARQNTALIVSRDTETLDQPSVLKATLESLLENSNDAVFASVFWFVVAGPLGVLMHRITNTLDAMWGYRSARFEQFGWAAARSDDLLNLIPARLTAVTFAFCGHCRVAFRCWRQQANQCKSPNGGVVMCAGAGSLGITLGGGARYRGHWQAAPQMGAGRSPEVADIDSGIVLIQRSMLVWCIVLMGVMVTGWVL